MTAEWLLYFIIMLARDVFVIAVGVGIAMLVSRRGDKRG